MITLALVWSTIFVLLALYEWVAVNDKKILGRDLLPTITKLIKSLPVWPTRLALVGLGILALVDHFFTFYLL